MEQTDQSVYSDGTVESRIQEYLRAHNGNCKGIIQSIPEGAVFHNFSKARENLLCWYSFEKDSRVLEIGAGMGALTTYLSSVCAEVVALEPSKDRADIISLRCAGMKNVTVVQASLDAYSQIDDKYDYVLLVGVLEYAGVFSDRQEPWLEMLRNARKMLKPNGKLLLAIENKFGLKYWCGAAEDHTGIPFDSVSDYEESGGNTSRYGSAGGVRTFSKYELETMLGQAGFAKQKFYYILPDYKFPMLILTDASVNADKLVQDVKFAYPSESTLVADERELFPQVIQNGKLDFFANSYLIEACNGAAEPSTVVTVSMKRDYKAAYQMYTILRDDRVLRIATSEESRVHVRELMNNTQILISRGVPCVPQEPFGENGTCCQYMHYSRTDSVFEDALRNNRVDIALRILDLLTEYLKKSGELIAENDQIMVIGAYPDLTLRNSFWVNDDFVFFDQEWRVDRLPLKYMVYRSLRYSVTGVSANTLKAIYDYCGITESCIEEYKAIEEQFLYERMDEENCKWFDPWMYNEGLKLQTVRTKLQTYQESERHLQGELSNSEHHVQQLLESERHLQGELSNSEHHVQQLLESERHLQGELSNSEHHVQQLLKSERHLLGELSNSEHHVQQLLKSEQQLQWKLADSEQSVRKHQELISQLETELNNKNGHVELLLKSDRELERIQSSRSWRFMSGIWRIRDFVLPKNSRRRLIIKLFWQFLRHPIQFMRKINKQRIKRLMDGLQTGQIQDTMERMNRCFDSGDVHADPVCLLEVSKGQTNEEPLCFEDYEYFSVPTSQNPTVSIVIPVYNQFHYTYACLRSIAQHSGDIPYEVLIANDCSTDLTTRLEEIVGGVKVITNEKNLRFLRNCNHAAKEAKGKYILFLNNDTQVQPNWLHPLIDLIESDEAIGMVGSKLIYPDGRLQEAGGILWKDASAWNYGHCQNPAMPEYNYVKEVDYISGAAIMIRTDLWKQLGGFDETFVPAYCEDSDLAFQVRAAGYKVMYQPKSVVVHFEGVSNGTDTSSGQKAYQIVNQKKFYEKWKDVLEHEHNPNGVDSFRARDRSLRKKTLLMIDHYVPQFDKDAGSRSMFQYLKLFVSQGYNVKFLGDNFYQHEPYTTILQQMGIEVLYGVWYRDHWREWIEQNAADFDYIFLSRPHITVKYVDFMKEKTRAKLVYYGHDLHFLREQKKYESTGDPKALEASIKFKKMESSIFEKVDTIYYLNNEELENVATIAPAAHVVKSVINIFEEIPDVDYVPGDRRDILFVGGFGHDPNVDAILWAVQEIMPRIWDADPDIKLRVVGSNATKEVMDLASDRVILEGFVPDETLQKIYASSRVVLVPLRYGGGIKGKVVEAMRYGLPVVTTETGAEGLDGIERFVPIAQKTPEDMAEKLLSLYHDDAALIRISRQEVKYIQENMSVSHALSILEKDFDFSGK